MTNGIIRLAKLTDAEALLAIYAYYVENTAATFETEVPSAREFGARIEQICKGYPCLAYEAGGEVLGYAYASRSRERAAYRYNADVSVYVRRDVVGQGIGAALYGGLFARLCDKEVYTVYAGITLPNEASVALHERYGFTQAGLYRNTGFKLGKWHDVVWMEKTLRDYAVLPE